MFGLSRTFHVLLVTWLTLGLGIADTAPLLPAMSGPRVHCPSSDGVVTGCCVNTAGPCCDRSCCIPSSPAQQQLAATLPGGEDERVLSAGVTGSVCVPTCGPLDCVIPCVEDAVLAWAHPSLIALHIQLNC